MTAQARIDAAADSVRSLHMPARLGEILAVESARRDNRDIRLCVLRDAEVVAEAELRATPGNARAHLAIRRPDGTNPADIDIVAVLIESAFQRLPELSCLLLPGFAGVPAMTGLPATSDGTAALIERSEFYQLPLLWRRPEAHVSYPPPHAASNLGDRPVPLRPPQPCGLMYRRFLPHLGLTLSLRPIDRRRDLALFHGWMNQPRVAFFWELAQSEAELDQYLATQEADPHLFGVIGSFNDQPVGYFEFYWAREDRLGPHYDAEDYDRGWHGLIGDARHLGRPKTLAWFRSLTHYLFLDEPRTRRIVGEPRASHHKMLSYCADVSYQKVKEFDFPHKRAALVCCERERFFREVVL